MSLLCLSLTFIILWLWMSGNINTSLWENLCHFPAWFLFRALHFPFTSANLCTSCPSSKCNFLFVPPHTCSIFTFESGYYTLPQQPLLHVLPKTTTKSAMLFTSFSFSPFVEACIYFQRLLYSAFYVLCFKPFHSPEHCQPSILALRGRWIFLEFIIQGKETGPIIWKALFDFTSHLNEWYICATRQCLLKWLIWSFLFRDGGRT